MPSFTDEQAHYIQNELENLISVIETVNISDLEVIAKIRQLIDEVPCNCGNNTSGGVVGGSLSEMISDYQADGMDVRGDIGTPVTLRDVANLPDDYIQRTVTDMPMGIDEARYTIHRDNEDDDENNSDDDDMDYRTRWTDVD